MTTKFISSLTIKLKVYIMVLKNAILVVNNKGGYTMKRQKTRRLLLIILLLLFPLLMNYLSPYLIDEY